MTIKNYLSFASLAAFIVAAGCSSSSTSSPSGDDNGGTIVVASGCTADSSVSCSEGDGYTCASGLPTDGEPDLSCSDGVTDSNGNTAYCCFEVAAGSTCLPDDSVTATCQGNSFGYSCDAGDNPQVVNPNFICSDPVASGSQDTFCCSEFAYSSDSGCAQDLSVTGCSGESYGFSCTSSATAPDDVDTSITCSTPVTDENGNSDYCCMPK